MKKSSKIVSFSILAVLLAGGVSYGAFLLGKSQSPKPEVKIEKVEVEKPVKPISKTGNFASVNHTTTGTATIKQENGKYYLHYENISTDQGPDLKVVISTGDKSTWKSNYFTLSNFSQIKGDSKYAIPEIIDVSKIKSALIWCEQHDSLFGIATLEEK